MTRSPYLGPIYNAGSTIAHLIAGTAGQYGPATTPIGRLLSFFSSNRTNAPAATAVTPNFPTVGGVPGAPQGPGFMQNDPTDPNNPGAYALNPPGAPQSTGNNPAQGGISDFYRQMYATGRVPGAQPFAPTLAQGMFPGSGIGPFQGVSNPYQNTRGAAGLGTPNTVDSGMSPYASILQAWIAAHTQQ